MLKPNTDSNKNLEQPSPDHLRSLAELQAAEDLLFHQVWFNRNKHRLSSIQDGGVMVVDLDNFPKRLQAMSPVERDILKRTMQTARDAVQRYGKESFGPWTDFEWGAISGKLSAIRWMLGDEWDVLDT
ncbi:MAG: hypothetical protein PHD65_12125 [Gallionella sp.]|nr:hypothetical protein [Gallionella sp.]